MGCIFKSVKVINTLLGYLENTHEACDTDFKFVDTFAFAQPWQIRRCPFKGLQHSV